MIIKTLIYNDFFHCQEKIFHPLAKIICPHPHPPTFFLISFTSIKRTGGGENQRLILIIFSSLPPELSIGFQSHLGSGEDDIAINSSSCYKT